MPSAASFAECQKSGTRRSHSLPSPGPGGTRQSLALGKQWLCRVPQSARHSAKGGTRQKPSLSSATLGKEWHLAKKMALDGRARPRRQILKKIFFVECRPWHSAKRAFAECQGPALGKDPFFAECHFMALGKGSLCRVSGPTLGKIFFFVFLTLFL